MVVVLVFDMIEFGVRVVRLLVADVSGHGEVGAEIAGRLRGLMRRHINSPDQRRLLSQINREFCDLSRPDQFATAVMVTCWTPTGELTVSCAGHPTPLRYHSQAQHWKPLFEPGEHAEIPLGIDPDTEFSQARITLGRSDLLLVYSDGVSESRDGGGQMLGSAGLASLLADLRGAPADGVVAGLVERVDGRRAGAPPEDDTTLMLIGPNELRPRDSVFSGLLAAMRMAKGMVVRR